MAKGFGNTWWGSRWLLSLTHIDYENRIPRGATYARAGAVREIKVKGNFITADTKIALSGTPVENRLTEFWSIMDYAKSCYLGNLKSFKSEYANPIQLYNDEEWPRGSARLRLRL